MFAAVHQMPVVEPGAAARLLIHVKADGMNDVQRAAERGGGSPDIARVVGDLGVEEHKMKHVHQDRKSGLPSTQRSSSSFESGR